MRGLGKGFDRSGTVRATSRLGGFRLTARHGGELGGRRGGNELSRGGREMTGWGKEVDRRYREERRNRGLQDSIAVHRDWGGQIDSCPIDTMPGKTLTCRTSRVSRT